MSISDACHGSTNWTGLRVNQGIDDLKIDMPDWGILTCANAKEGGFEMNGCFESLFANRPIKDEKNFNSPALVDMINTLHEGKEYRLPKTVNRRGNAFEARELDLIRSIVMYNL